ncbi:MAG: S-layer homology domain-containing protein [Acidobacteriota bacterium]
MKAKSLVFFLIIIVGCVTKTSRVILIEKIPPVLLEEFKKVEKEEFERAWSLLEKGYGRKAYLKLKRFDVNKPSVLVAIGYSYLLRGNVKKSEGYFIRALEINNAICSSHVGLAQLYEMEGKNREAFLEWKKTIELNPENNVAKERMELIKKEQTKKYIGEGKYLVKKGDVENARKLFIMALFFTPESYEAHYELFNIYKLKKDRKGMIEELKKLTQLEPENYDLKKQLGGILFEDKQYKEALEIYRELFRSFPDDISIREKLELVEKEWQALTLPAEWRKIPEKSVITRGELASIISNKFNYYFSHLDKKPPIITDISGTWYYSFILEITSLGIMDVYPNHAFYPGEMVKRQDLAEIIGRLIELFEKLKLGKKKEFISRKMEIRDVSSEHWHWESIRKAVSYGFMSLFPDGTFRPNNFVSGKETLEVFNRITEIYR